LGTYFCIRMVAIMKNTIQSVKGTRDFYPEDMAFRTWLYGKIRQVSESFGYQEYEAPILEKVDLYAAKSGEELVKEQAFVFPDRGGELITLRPELTPSLARMVAQRANQLIFPLRWWSFGPFWRYEKPQKGRAREFFQWNIDLFGVNSPEADAELLAICASLFKAVGLTPDQVKLLVNDRRLVDRTLSSLNIPPLKRIEVYRLIDRREKMTPPEWFSYAQEIGLTAEQVNGIDNFMEEGDAWETSPELSRAFALLGAMGFRDYVSFSPRIIRGLDYYTGVVFEAKDLDGGRSILGGGRYDNLVSDVGGEPVPGVGFAMGDVMAGIVLKKYGCVPELSTQPAQIMVTIFDDASFFDSQKLAADLRTSGINVICYPETAKLQKQFKFADRMTIPLVIVLGPDEISQGKVTVKDLPGQKQQIIERSELVGRLNDLLAQS